MKKLLFTLLISLNLAMPARAALSTAVLGPLVMGGIVIGGSVILLKAPLSEDIVDNPMYPLLLLAAILLFDGEKNSANNFVSVNALNDIEALISAKIYTETEGNDLKSEWRAFQSYLSESEKEFIFINSEQVQDMSPEEVVATIQSQVGDRKLLAEYLASKMSVQVQ